MNIYKELLMIEITDELLIDMIQRDVLKSPEETVATIIERVKIETMDFICTPEGQAEVAKLAAEMREAMNREEVQ
jgi:hypothetical protein